MTTVEGIEARRGQGWHTEERHEAQPFRWMAGRATCHFSVPNASAWVCIAASHTHPGEHRTLSARVNGVPVGSAVVRDRFCDVLFPIPCAGECELELTVDRVFVPPTDPRELGLKIRSITILNLDARETPLHGEGWYDEETGGYFPYRWMAARAKVMLPAAMRGKGRFLALPACSDVPNGEQVLEVRAGDALVERIGLLYSWHVYDIELPAAGREPEPLELTLSLGQLLPDTVRGADTRELGARVGPITVHDDRRRHELVRTLHGTIAGHAGPEASLPRSPEVLPSVSLEAALPADGPGWYWWEPNDLTPYRWMGRSGTVSVPAACRGAHAYVRIPVYSEYANLSQVLTVTIEGRAVAELALPNRWFDFHFPLPPPADGDLHIVLSVNKLVPPAYAEGDWRELGIRVGQLTFHDDQAQFDRARWTYDNALRNLRELHEGATILESFPIGLGIDLFGKCNIKPACVYCPWDEMKALEGDTATTLVDEGTFAGYGPFFDGPSTLVNCSFGEPLLHPRLTEVLDFFDRRNKTVELSTNGQAFTPATVRALAGRRVKLFVSLDSASAETYARLRNERWDDVVAGLTVLREVRRRSRWLPTVQMVFMPMKANVHELESFVKLCRLVEADTLMLRPLQLASDRPAVTRGGYRYDYTVEPLAPEALREVFENCERWCREHGVKLVKQFDFGRTEPEQRHMGERNDA